MATGTVTVLNDCRAYLDEFDLSGQANRLGAGGTTTMQEKTSFASGGWREFEPGLRKGKLELQTYLNEDLTDDGLWIGTELVVSSFVVDDAEFSVGYCTTGSVAELGQEATVGNLLMQPITIDGSGVMFRGELLLPKAAQTSAGNGSSRQLGAVAATETVFANLHVFAVTGGSVTVTVESDTATEFPSTATQLSFAAASAVGSESVSAAGAVTDTWWRVAWTQTASSATFAVVVGIQ